MRAGRAEELTTGKTCIEYGIPSHVTNLARGGGLIPAFGETRSLVRQRKEGSPLSESTRQCAQSRSWPTWPVSGSVRWLRLPRRSPSRSPQPGAPLPARSVGTGRHTGIAAMYAPRQTSPGAGCRSPCSCIPVGSFAAIPRVHGAYLPNASRPWSRPMPGKPCPDLRRCDGLASLQAAPLGHDWPTPLVFPSAGPVC